LFVNNASPVWDASIKGRELRLIDLPENVARAGNNIGSRQRGDVVVLLNCDAWLDRAFSAQALRVFERNPRIGSVVPKVLCGDNSGRLDSAGHVMRSDRTCINRGHGEQDQGQYDQSCFVFGGQAAAIAYRRDMLDALAWQVQVFELLLHFEDVDSTGAQPGGWPTSSRAALPGTWRTVAEGE
jgi:GT2 family glycosyltransferase